MYSIQRTIGILLALLVPVMGATGISSGQAPPPPANEGPSQHFMAGHHVVGFSPRRVYMASLQQALVVEFVNANSVAPVSSIPAAKGKPGALDRVTYPNQWQGVDVVYERDTSDRLKSTYQLAAGADPSAIGIRYNAPVELQADGSLNIRLQSGTVTESAPVAWQIIDGEKSSVQVRFKQTGPSEVGFVTGSYHPEHPLTIDPTYTWHTFLGGTGAEIAYAICLDGSGNLIVAGQCDTAFNVGATTPKNAHAGGSDMVVVKLGSDGAYQWHTFVGGTLTDIAYGVSVDGSGNVLVAGTSAGAFNVGESAPQNAHSGSLDMLIAKLASDGTYQWHTFVGGTGLDIAYGVDSDSSGNVVAAGYSAATFDVGQGPPLNDHSGGNDMVVAKLDSSGAYQWHTFLGGTGTDRAYGVCVDSGGNVIAVGQSGASFDVGISQPVNAFTGGSDLVVAKLASDGSCLWHAFYGSAGSEGASGVAVDSTNNVLVAGYASATFNVGTAVPNNPHAGGDDMLVIKLTGNGVYQWHAFYGSPANEAAKCVTVDAAGNPVVAGTCFGNFNVDGIPPGNAYSTGTGSDMAVVRLGSAGNYEWHTMYGLNASTNPGNADASYTPYGVCVSPTGDNVYLAGDGLILPGSTFHGGSNGLLGFEGSSDMLIIKTATKATVTYSAGLGGGAVPTDPNAYPYRALVTVLFTPLPTRTGYTFTGWSDGRNTYTSSGSKNFEIGASNVTLTAQWTATPVSNTVTFNSNGGTGTMASQAGTSGTTAKLTPNSFSRTGHTFKSWNTKADGTGTSYANGADYTFTANVTLYAQWKVKICSIIYLANGGNGSMYGASGAFGITFNLKPVDFTRRGHTFEGWNTKADGTGTSYANGASYTFTADVSLYAQWKVKIYKVIFLSNVKGPDWKEVQSGGFGTTSRLTPNRVTYTGYTFKGWNTKADGTGTSYANGANYTFTADVTLYAQWKAEVYEVVFKANRGAGEMAPQDGEFDTSVKLTPNGFSRTGHTFKGWNTRADGTGTSYANGADYTFTADVTLYAQWRQDPVTVTFYSNAENDGDVLESSENSNVGGALNSKARTMILGDDAGRKQYRGILSFNTSTLPDTAMITSVTLTVKRKGSLGGGNPVSMFGGFMIDVKNGFFGSTAQLEKSDFQEKANQTYGPFLPALSGGRYSVDLTAGKSFFNKTAKSSGLTQIRLRFKIDDNNNSISDYLSFFSGNEPTSAARPRLIITYTLP